METRKQFTIQGVLGLLTIFAVTNGRSISVPDNVRKVYGLPLAWGVHQLISIAGPIDSWSINIIYLVFDLLFWVGLVIVSPILYEQFSIVSCERFIE